jgi:hypothetical protein
VQVGERVPSQQRRLPDDGGGCVAGVIESAMLRKATSPHAETSRTVTVSLPDRDAV